MTTVHWSATTVKDSGGNLKSQQTGTEQIMWMVTTQLFVNLYYILPTTQFILPGDTATITAGGQTWTIPVDSLSSYLNSDTYTVFGSAPPGQNVKVIDGTQRSVSQIVTASSSGAYSATNPFATYFDGSCSSMAQSLIFGPGHAGRAYLTHSDGNAVFAVWARSMHVNENENFLEVFAYSTQNLDWYDPGFVQVTASRTPAGGGTPNGATAKSDGGQAGDTKINIVDSSNNKIIIRPGDTISVSFTEGVGTASRTATLTATAIPQVTGVPDVTSGTLAGIGPSAWSGRATLANPPSTPIAINARTYPAFGPASFTQYGGTPVPLIMGYAGDVSFTDSTGNRVWSAWAVTAFPVKITKIPNVGDTMVCGTAPASSPVRIHDFTNQPTDVIIGTGSSDANGNFCVATTPLFKGQVIMAESNGTFSQPIVVGIAHLVFIPVTFH